MGIHQATHQKQCLKRIIALCKFVPANTAAVCQDVVVPDDEFNIQDGSGSCRLCPVCGSNIPHAGSKSEFALAVHRARQVDCTAVLNRTHGVRLDAKVHRVHLAGTTSGVLVVSIWLHLLVEALVLFGVKVRTVGGELQSSERRR